jgi:hypothetical protein
VLAAGGSGVVLGGWDRRPHLLPAMADGWKAIRRGLPQSAIDLEAALPGLASAPFVGYQLKPLLAPVALRSTPLPAAARAGLAAAGMLAAWAVWKAVATNGSRKTIQAGGTHDV